jgi:hypothetical protein
MSEISRPMQIALLATVLLAMVWFVALRPKGTSTEDAAPPPATPAQEAPSAPSAAAPQAPVAEEPSVDKPKPSPAARAAIRPQPGDSAEVRNVRAALRQHKAVALAFVTATSADARAVAREIRAVSNFGGRAAIFEVPLADLSDYGFITREVEVTVAPTTIVVGRDRRATAIVGFADRFEIEQRLADALAQR